MVEYAAYDVEDTAHSAAPVDIAGYDPDTHRQTASMVSLDDCHPDTQCAYDDRDR